MWWWWQWISRIIIEAGKANQRQEQFLHITTAALLYLNTTTEVSLSDVLSSSESKKRRCNQDNGI